MLLHLTPKRHENGKLHATSLCWGRWNFGPDSSHFGGDDMGSEHPSPNVKKPSACSSGSFGQKLSHHVMPKVLVLKAQDVMF